MPTPGLGTVHAVKGSVLGSGKSLISLIANLAFAKSLFVYSSLCGSLPPRSAWNTAARGGGSGLRVPVLLWASVQCSRSCSVSPQLLTSQAKACFHISEKSEWGRRCWRYRLIWAISPRKRFNFSMHENITKKNRHQIAFFFFFWEAKTFFICTYLPVCRCSESSREGWVGSAGWEVQCMKQLKEADFFKWLFRGSQLEASWLVESFFHSLERLRSENKTLSLFLESFVLFCFFENFLCIWLQRECLGSVCSSSHFNKVR